MRQLAQDAMTFIGEVIDEKEADQNAFFNFMDNIAATIDSSVRKEDPAKLQKRIAQLQKGLSEGTTTEQQQKLIDLGKLYLEMDNQQQAFEYFDRAVQLDKDSQQGLEALFFKGYVYKLQGQYEKARESQKKCALGRWKSKNQ